MNDVISLRSIRACRLLPGHSSTTPCRRAPQNILPGDKAELLAEVRIRLAPSFSNYNLFSIPGIISKIAYNTRSLVHCTVLWSHRFKCVTSYGSMNSSWKYYSGEELQLPAFSTLFIGGNHDASNYIGEL
ncbi:hypothetical protein KY290_022470 [Solanum tuberosum]|uniref:Uncharacterized protein n=1 Tax=Solanum tuberosum TaxID=4113 RepID=A0ABQ7V6J4_SOLTU|nr:hypothetical protein KY284_021367 [Solanum tuberosum]KAH0758977.1 hypothetical protein KY290_022470 [Solanum tuberosum]